MALDTEFACNFCAEIGPLQLGVVLVVVKVNTHLYNDYDLKL